MSQPSPLSDALRERSGDQCELCGGSDSLEVRHVGPGEDQDPARCVLICGTCSPQVEGDAALDATHLFCLQEAIWSEVPAVVVVSWRLLSRLSGEVWPQDLLDQVYLEEEVLQWAEQGMADEKESSEEHVRTFDSNGAELFEGDSVTLIKDLDVKGTAFVAKRGTLVKGIRLTGDPDNIEGRVNKISIVLKTCFLKKAN